MGENRTSHRLLGGKQREREHWEDQNVGVDNNKMDLVELDWDGVDWIGLVQDRYRWRVLVNAVMNSKNAGKLWSGYTTGGLSSSSQLHRVSYAEWSYYSCQSGLPIIHLLTSVTSY
jgi:hypothetical protein